MNDAVSNQGFDNVLPAQSAAIYREFSQGKVLLRQMWNQHRAERVDNPLYNLVYNQLSHFRRLYEHLGFELVFHETGGFFYLRESLDEESDEHDENALRVQVILLLIGRYFARGGRDLEFLGRPDAGLKETDLQAMAADEEYLDILRTARIEKGWPEAMDYLTKRHFIFRSGAERYFLSSAGMAFLYQLVSEYEASSSSPS
ncbi:condensin complex protein MksE [Pistricoccus aurantiacus]|uniref:condensin complex protein MksE n=1 Tax=Pistricoccus aurantiacus TaxID=1883414 RepID=UPI003637BED4